MDLEYLEYQRGLLETYFFYTNIKNFSAIVKKYYTCSPGIICLIMALVCCLINTPFAFNYQSVYAGDYTYNNGNKINKLYVLLRTDEASSTIGQTVIISLYVVRDILTLIVGIVLNLVLLVQMRNYLIERAKRFGPNTSVGSGSMNGVNRTTRHG